jgi:hypothetical protein
MQLCWFSDGLWPGCPPQCPDRRWDPPSLLSNGYWGLLPQGVRRSGHIADPSPPSSAEVKESGAIPPLPHMSSWHSAYLIKHRDNFTFLYTHISDVQDIQLTCWLACESVMSGSMVPTSIQFLTVVRIVVYFWHARTITSKQYMKRRFLCAEPCSYKHLDNARVGKDHVTTSAVTQQLKPFPACQIKGL